MQLGMIGLGKMGGNMARRLLQSGFGIVGYDRDGASAAGLAKDHGLVTARSIDDLVSKVVSPRVVWMMLPAGSISESVVEELAGQLEDGDVLVDGGNSWYRDSLRRGERLAELGIEFVDAGVSGGVWGLENGYSLMVGGSDAAFARLRPAIEALAPAPDRGWIHTGPTGSGHFVKMVHNGIEYGMMQAYAEGFALMRAHEDWDLDLGGIAETWRHGSVVRSWLLDLSAGFLAEDRTLDGIEPNVADSGEGRWTALEGIELGVPTPVINLALTMRFASQGGGDYGAKMLAMMRSAFGGHAVRETGDEGQGRR